MTQQVFEGAKSEMTIQRVKIDTACGFPHSGVPGKSVQLRLYPGIDFRTRSIDCGADSLATAW
jgi:hypothetical protein